MKTILSSIIIFISTFSIGQNADISKPNRKIVLTEIANKIKEFYIFEDVANQLSVKLKSQIELKTFDSLTDKEFAISISSYLTQITR
jgi:hypothetical protein